MSYNEQAQERKNTFVSWEDEQEMGTYVTYQIYNIVNPGQSFGAYDLLLDNQANVHIVYVQAFIFHLPSGDLEFKSIGKLYTAHKW